MPYPALDASGLRLRRGQVSLTVAAPGTGKSMLWMNFAVRMKAPALYWSADTDQHDVFMRAAALLGGYTTESVDQFYSDGDVKAKAYFDEKLVEAQHIDWIFDSAIPAKRVAERLLAFVEVHGEYPQLVVLDNLSNAVEHQESELAEQKEFMTEVQRLARFTRAHFAVLAHAEGKYDDGMTPIPQSGVYNKLSKLPEVVLTLNRINEAGRDLAVNVVKQRGGISSAAAHNPVTLPVDFSCAYVGGLR